MQVSQDPWPAARTIQRAWKRKRTSRSSAAVTKFHPSIRYNGEYKFTRMANGSLTLPTAGVGFSISASNYQAFFMYFSPLTFTCCGSSVNQYQVSVPNASEIQALWDRIRIDKVDVSFSIKNQNVSGNDSTGNARLRLWVAPDYNDGITGVTDQTVIQQNQGCKYLVLDGFNEKTVTVYPKYQRIVYYTAVSSSYEPARGFVSTGTDIPHYGLKVGCDLASLGTDIMFMNVKFYFTVRNVR